MNYEKFGIIATVVILAGVLTISSIAQNTEFNYDFYSGPDDVKIPNITASTDTSTKSDGFYNYCYKMGIDC